MTTRTVWGSIGAFAGFATVFVEIGFYWQAHVKGGHYEMSPVIIAIGAIIVFIGGALLDFKRAKDITGVVVSSGVTILGAIPLPWGKRWTDRVASKAAPGIVVLPTPVPDPVVTEEHDGP